jgi:hypothetical protein
MTVKCIKKPFHSLLMVVSGRACCEFLATAEFVDKVDNLFDRYQWWITC